MEEFSKQFSALPVKNMDELIESQSPALHMVDRQALTLCISLEIGKYLNFVGCSMTEEATYETAMMMIDTHPHLTVDAIKTFFYNCKRGAYGFHYNKMDGSKLLMWFDKFVNEYYVQLEDAEYNKHFSTKGDLATPIASDDDEMVAVNYEELCASFNGLTQEEYSRKCQIEDIRKRICNENMHLYDEMSVEEADKIIEDAIIKELQANQLLTF